jgi:integrase/recombinase XerD
MSRGGQLAVFGKGRKTRVILPPADIFLAILALRGEAWVDDPVFRSRKVGMPLSRVQAMRVVQVACRGGIAGAVSPHWLRHAHATHALNRGAPIHLVADTLGHASVATTGMYAHANPTESSARYLPQ